MKIIGKSLGVVNEIHYNKNNFSSVEIEVIMVLTNCAHRFSNTICVQDGTRKCQVIVREIGPLLRDNDLFCTQDDKDDNSSVNMDPPQDYNDSDKENQHSDDRDTHFQENEADETQNSPTINHIPHRNNQGVVDFRPRNSEFIEDEPNSPGLIQVQ